jgi:hypothetical protein
MSRCIHRSEGRLRGGEKTRIGKSAAHPKKTQEFVGATIHRAEETQFLKNECPGNYGKNEENQENDASDPTGLFEEISQLADKEEKNQT